MVMKIVLKVLCRFGIVLVFYDVGKIYEKETKFFKEIKLFIVMLLIKSFMV